MITPVNISRQMITPVNISRQTHSDLALLAVRRSNDAGYRITVVDILKEAITDVFQKYNHKQL